MGRSMRATILGLGGEHYDLGADGAIAFQPLARIDRDGYRTWAAEWVEGRLSHEGITVGPDEKAAVWSALGSLAGAPLEQRTQIGRAHVCTPVTNAHLVCRLQLAKQK